MKRPRSFRKGFDGIIPEKHELETTFQKILSLRKKKTLYKKF